MSSCPKVISQSEDVDERLLEIGGLTREVLVEAALLGEQARQSCTHNDPVTAPGMMAYFARVRGLRDQLLPLGWKAKCDGGSEKTITPDGRHAVVVASGDENTGSLFADPKTKCPKGVRMEEATERNEEQITLFAELGLQAVAVLQEQESTGALTWVFLVSREGDLLTLELSLPVAMGDDGRPESWSERIILPPETLDDGNLLTSVPAGPEPGPEFDVEVIFKN